MMVSTDDAEIASAARRYGADVPFMRSAATSGDAATTSDAVCEVLHEFARRGKKFSRVAVVYPCVPFLTSKLLADAWQAFMVSDADSLLPVARYSFPVQRAMVRNNRGFLEYREPENAMRRTQDFEPAYHDAGMFCLSRTESLLQTRSLVSPRTILFEMPSERVQDIDTPDDWAAAEFKYRILNGA